MSAAPATAVCFQARRGPGGDAFCRSLGTVNRERPGTAGSSLIAESPAFALVVQLGWAKLRFLLLGPYHLLPAALLLPPSPHPLLLLGCVWSWCVGCSWRARQRPDGFDTMVFPGAFLSGVALTPYHTGGK